MLFLKSSTATQLWIVLVAVAAATVKAEFKLPNLPYAHKDLEPYISSSTLNVHHGNHHAKYIATLNHLVKGGGRDLKKMSLDEIVVEAHKREDTGLFNNAAQSWNHGFYWKCMKPGGGGEPTGLLLEKIQEHFGSYAQFATEFKNAGNTAFGSGWAWLVYHKAGGALQVTKTIGAGNPMTTPGLVPILCMDVWEHAYYLDYQNKRPEYADTFLEKLVNWDFVADNLKEAMESSGRGEEL
ncbi:Superoxide dismutase [Fe] [Seminavis robusta]|uniref:Superoxide dismutase n=1 Tax=Seminavis robusta TaxID=568900 RepID=A0A9N8HM68_9STRA|nr:Superoxide dismutase [Fe] [Seminavis robusta]|eukprot:Sro882_g215360.1 Superoxide dismutase [Fe] (239) ;mRNA; f:25437-26153